MGSILNVGGMSQKSTLRLLKAVMLILGPPQSYAINPSA